jgi:exopolyphosphatase/guanosine-5'-triphosphate,3'-diphosphate pyrophosphatase
VASIARKIQKCSPIAAIGSSGTIMTLERLAQRMQKVPGVVHQQGILTRKELKSLCSLLAGLSHSDRSLLPNMNKERADIIVAGSYILYGIMKECNIQEIQTTEFGLRDGMLVDYLSRHPGFLQQDGFNVREMSIQRLAKRFHVDIEHANHVAHVAAQLFDSACSAGLITHDARTRELLRYAAKVHDVGHYISFSRHHIHSAYIVQNAGMVGFSELEILIIALLCRYHRRRSPREKDPGYSLLSPSKQRTVLILSFMLRFAEALDRSHDGRVEAVTIVQEKNDDREIHIMITAQNDCTLEIFAVQEDIPLFTRVFSREVKIFVQNSSTMPN